MSEQLLQAIIRLFALVAKEDSVTEQERKNIEGFLLGHLSEEMAEKYLTLFDQLSALQDSNESQEITEICAQINRELKQAQKLVLILQLIELIQSDGDISPKERELVFTISEGIKITPHDTEKIFQLVGARTVSDLDDSSFLVIQDTPSVRSAHSLEVKHLSGFIGILRLTDVETYFIRYEGDTALYLNGIPLKNKQVSIYSTGSSIKGENIRPIYYSDVISRFKVDESDGKINFVARKISYTFKTGTIGLRNVNVVEEGGKLIGLMGASGSGKSTLLNVLNGNETPTEGYVHINGYDIHKEPHRVEGLIGYVPQDDLLMEDLTVGQNLYYAAKLCFGQYSEEELNELVLKTLSSLGLSETKDLKVGSPLEKTISGGQRKRVNIGLELLREPSVLFVDEPTSGLSSRDSENIMDLLKELSLKGKLIFVVIHQPSSDIFKMFDKLVILDVGGYQIYYGNPVDGVLYFKDIIEMVDRDKGACLACGNVNPEQIFNIIETKVVNEYGRLTDERRISPKRWNKYFEEKIEIPSPAENSRLPEIHQQIPNKVKQLKVFIARDLLSKLSNKQYLLINLLEAPVLAFILAYIVRYFQTDSLLGYQFSKNMNIPAFFFMSIIVALFMGLTVSAEEIIKDRKILKREAFLHLSKGSYLFSKILIMFGFSAVQTFCYVLIGDFILEIDGMNASYWLVLFSISCFANLMGLNISSAFNSAVTIYILIPILLIPQLMLSGVVVKFDNLNPHISSKSAVPLVGEVMASRWAFEALMVSQFKDNAYGKLFYPLDKAMANAEYKTVYWLPKIESELSFCLQSLRSEDDLVKQQIEHKLALIQNELRKELDYINYDKFTKLDEIKYGTFNGVLAEDISELLGSLKRYYNNIFNKASTAKDQLIFSLTDASESGNELDLLKNTFYNESIAEIVKNTNDPKRILEEKDELIQKVYPIYMNANPAHFADFRAQIYVPEKHFAGLYMDTYYFNILVIWLMTLFLTLALYQDWLRKIVNR
ncbi:ATP-binding cassette domain-containing protein [Cytophagales bacterium LB-30]|uniref:ATP-binding cassette domain-containing protein n=1 Tax=Shiella aurantiaca TaxID=3058365 RepID=A0ABT8F5J9_9BACT|nr:ATP-binding cassette domain-containing protein [Shiella aurantiaca]MDN4165665.1 ATP-binding cassette domain-containing protein [Shiella aurantiaca]